MLSMVRYCRRGLVSVTYCSWYRCSHWLKSDLSCMQSADKLFSNRRPHPFSPISGCSQSLSVLSARYHALVARKVGDLSNCSATLARLQLQVCVRKRKKAQHYVAFLLCPSIYSYISFKASLSPKHVSPISLSPQRLNSSADGD